jgi:hypothetical protein
VEVIGKLQQVMVFQWRNLIWQLLLSDKLRVEFRFVKKMQLTLASMKSMLMYFYCSGNEVLIFFNCLVGRQYYVPVMRYLIESRLCSWPAFIIRFMSVINIVVRGNNNSCAWWIVHRTEYIIVFLWFAVAQKMMARMSTVAKQFVDFFRLLERIGKCND